MGRLDEYKPVMVMVGLQFCYAGVSLTMKAALLTGMSPRVFVLYRQAIATLVIAPIAYLSRRKSGGTSSMGLKSFSLIFLTSLIGVTINQNIFSEGVYLASSSIASAVTNLVPTITFIMASILGLEKINIKSYRSIAKIVGTIICVSGAISMALLRGPKLLNSFLGSLGEEENWLLGCLLLFGSACCWSLWLILQVPVTASYPDHLSLSAWMCFLATIQSAILTVCVEKDLEALNLHSYMEVICCLFSGILGSGLAFFVQAWCISKRGPLFSAMFNPLNTVIVTILAALLLHEEIYTGSLIGAVGVVVGLYVMLWGKAKDLIEIRQGRDPKLEVDQTETVQIFIGESTGERNCKDYLKEPLLPDKANDTKERNHTNQ